MGLGHGLLLWLRWVCCGCLVLEHCGDGRGGNGEESLPCLEEEPILLAGHLAGAIDVWREREKLEFVNGVGI